LGIYPTKGAMKATGKLIGVLFLTLTAVLMVVNTVSAPKKKFISGFLMGSIFLSIGLLVIVAIIYSLLHILF
jgi:hypothetical protein